jgi:hypothetical protein
MIGASSVLADFSGVMCAPSALDALVAASAC